jgi:hypothetical protein
MFFIKKIHARFKKIKKEKKLKNIKRNLVFKIIRL